MWYVLTLEMVWMFFSILSTVKWSIPPRTRRSTHPIHSPYTYKVLQPSMTWYLIRSLSSQFDTDYDMELDPFVGVCAPSTVSSFDRCLQVTLPQLPSPCFFYTPPMCSNVQSRHEILVHINCLQKVFRPSIHHFHRFLVWPMFASHSSSAPFQSPLAPFVPPLCGQMCNV